MTDAIATALAAQQCTLRAWHIDRAYWPVHWSSSALMPGLFSAKRGQYGPVCISTTAFQLDWERHELRCPGGETMPFEPGEW